jgi:hypothetical protein
MAGAWSILASCLVPRDPNYGNGIPRTGTGLEMYRLSHKRRNAVQARNLKMLACRYRDSTMFKARQRIKHKRMASLYRKCAGLHQQCADIPRDAEMYNPI